MQVLAGSRFLIVAAACAGALAACERPTLCPDAHFDQDIVVPALTATLDPSIARFGAHTAPGQSKVEVAIVDNRGTISFEGRGPIPAFVYGRVPWPDLQRTLYLGLGIEDGTWYEFWLYCTDDNRLTQFYGAMTDRDLGVLEVVDGECLPSLNFQPLTIDIPAHVLRRVALTCGFAVTAPTGSRPIDLGGSRAGSIELSGRTATVLPFHTVDCRTDCGQQSWYELHALVWEPTGPQIGFTIFYLDGSGVDAGNGLIFPGGTDIPGLFPNATWSLAR